MLQHKNHLDIALSNIYTSHLIYVCHFNRLWNYCTVVIFLFYFIVFSQ